MKKLLTLSFSLLLTFTLASCGGPSEGGSGSTEGSSTDTSTSTSSGTITATSIDTSGLDPDDRIQTYYFYIDYWHSEEPYFTLNWWQGLPLGQCPEECKLTSNDATDPLFPVFLGWSEYSSSIDDSKLWNFASDAKFPLIVELYGIWVSNE